MDNQKNHQREGKAICDGFGGGSGGGGGGNAGQNSNHPPPRPCPRCHSHKTKFCYFNNYSLSQPRYYCKGCKRYWTQGGTLRNVPVGGGCRKSKRPKMDPSASTSAAPPAMPPMQQENYFQHQMLVTAALSGASGSGGGVGDMLFGVRENTNTAGHFMQTLPATHEPGRMSQPPLLGRELSIVNGLTLLGYLPNNPQNQLLQNVYSTREVGSSSAPAAMADEWTIGGVQPGAPQLPPSLLEANNNDNTNNSINNININDDDDEISRQWADYMGNGGLGGEP